MFSVAAATSLAKPFGVGVPAAPELLEGGRRSASGPHTGRIRPQAKRIRRGELDAAFFFPPRMQLPTAAAKMTVTLRMDLA